MENEWPDGSTENYSLTTNKPTVEELMVELRELAGQLSDMVLGEAPIEIPDSTEEIGIQYYHMNELHNRMDNIFKSIKHSRELLKVALNGAMDIKGEVTIAGPNGSKLRRQATIYAKIEDKPKFVDWCNQSGNMEYLEIKPRKGSKNEPGVDLLVRDMVKQARAEQRDIVLPPGLSYSEPPRIVVTQPSESNVFDEEAKGIVERLMNLEAKGNGTEKERTNDDTRFPFND